MNPSYNLFLLISIVAIFVPFAIGVYKDAKESLSDLKKRKDEYIKRMPLDKKHSHKAHTSK